MVLSLAFSLVAVAAGGPPSGTRGHFIVALNEGVDSETAARDLGRVHGLGIGLVFDTVINGFSATVPLNRVRAVESDDRVRVVVVDTLVPDVLEAQTVPTGIDRIDAEPTANTTSTGVGVSIANLDTGIARNHPDLNVVGRVTLATGGDGDKNGHGTHTAGTAAALDNSIQVVGVAPGADLYDVKVLSNSGSARYSWLIGGLECVADPNGDGNTSDHLDVANMSWGIPPDSGGLLATAIINAWDAGVTLVTSAGNEGEDVDDVGKLPQTLSEDKIIVVSAIDDFDDSFASFSNFGPKVDIAAPGVGILSTWVNNFLATASGTSMASPHVAGTAALYIAANPGATPAQVATALIANGEAITSTADDGIAEPLVDAEPFATAGGGGTSNNPPVASNVNVGTGTVQEDSTNNAWTPSVSDDDAGDTLTCTITVQPINGTATVAPNCSSGTYTPDADFNGSDPFTYQVSDGKATDTGTVSVTVNAVPDDPVANDVDMGTVLANSSNNAWTPSVSDVDAGDTLTCTITVQPSNGSAAVASDCLSGTYTPDANFTGSDPFTYEVSDGTANDTGSVSVTVSEPSSDIHVGDLDGASEKLSQGYWKATVTIEVHDGSGGAVVGAEVTGTFTQNGDAVDPPNCTTDATGTSQIDSGQLPNKSGKATFTVDNVTHATLTYDGTANNDPDGDSDGTSIALSK